MKKIFAYAHTHWDREWYKPFETFRSYLVHVLRLVLDELEAGKLGCFYLDGQAIVLEDAFEIAPELASRITSLMAQGKLAAGPWYVLPDQMLVCGESLIRNLKLGISTVKKYGEPALIGYAPDTFGHSQDLPRILSGFGIGSAFIWRGVPRLSFGPCFRWQSPDGSCVLAYHLSKGYYQTSLIEKSQNGFSNNSLSEYAEELRALAADRQQWGSEDLYEKTINLLLYPIGGDHTAPPLNLTETMQELNNRLKSRSIEFALVQLGEFAGLLEQQAKNSSTLIGTVTRELRDNSNSQAYNNAYLLPGVLSSRLYLKRENREAERRLFRFCEPLFSILAVRSLMDYPQGELSYALRLLLKNHPHDSICGCSIDAVHDEMLTRFARMHETLEPLLDKAKRKLSLLPGMLLRSVDDPSLELKRLRVINPSARTFSGVVPLEWFEALDDGSPSAVCVRPGAALQVVESRAADQLFSGWGQVPYYSMVSARKGLVWVDNVPGFGETNIDWPLDHTEASKTPSAKLRGKVIDNGILRVSVNKQGKICVIWNYADGNQRRYELEHTLHDTADGGDTYNYDPVRGDRPIIARLSSVRPGKKGPLVASLLLKYEIKIPESLLEGTTTAPDGSEPLLPMLWRGSKRVHHEIETEVIVKKGSRILEFETHFENHVSGHRLEVLLSTGYPVYCSFAENHFSLVRRYHQIRDQKVSLPVEAGHEAPCDRFPAQRFVIANGQVFLNKGLPEYGAEGDSLSLTLLRSVSLLSKGRIRSRGGGAGPHLAVPGAECRGPNRASYAWAPLSIFQKHKLLGDYLDDEDVIEACDLAEAYEQELFCAFSASADTASPSLLQADHAGIRPVGAYISGDREELYFRLQNLCNEAITCKLTINFNFQSVHLCRLDEEVSEEAFLYREYIKASAESTASQEACALEIKFGPSELKTIRFRLKEAAFEQSPAAARARKKRSSGASKTG